MSTDYRRKNARRAARKRHAKRLAATKTVTWEQPKPTVVGAMHAMHQAAQRAES